DCGGSCGGWADQMGAHVAALAALEIAIGGGDAALARLAAIAITAGAHGAARFAPDEAGGTKYLVEPSRLRLALHSRGAGHDQRDDALGHFSPARDGGGGGKIGQARIGARADEHAVDR